MKSNTYQEMIKPFIVLVVICIVTGALLGFTNSLTAPIIEANEIAEAEATRKAMLPEATGFEEIEPDPAWGVDSVYKDVSGSGYVITTHAKGYGGNVVVTIGFDNDGRILHMAVDASTETQGVGSKTANQANIDKYIGLSGSVEGNKDLLITSATFSSTAVRTSVQNAMNAMAALTAAN